MNNKIKLKGENNIMKKSKGRKIFGFIVQCLGAIVSIASGFFSIINGMDMFEESIKTL